MRAALLSCVLPTLFAPCLAAQAKPPAQAKPVPAATADYKDEALVFEHWDTTVRMHPDGTGDRNEHVVLRLQSEGAIRQFVFSRSPTPPPRPKAALSTWKSTSPTVPSSPRLKATALKPHPTSPARRPSTAT